MKSIWVIALSLVVVAAPALCLADVSSAEPSSFPSIGEILSTVQPSGYSIDTFVHDVQYMFSSEMLANMADYGGKLVTFVTQDTFYGQIGNGDLSAQFENNYINLFVLLCSVIAVICILGAVISLIKNRGVYKENRE